MTESARQNETGQAVEAKVRNGTVIPRVVGCEDGARKATPIPI